MADMYGYTTRHPSPEFAPSAEFWAQLQAKYPLFHRKLVECKCQVLLSESAFDQLQRIPGFVRSEHAGRAQHALMFHPTDIAAGGSRSAAWSVLR